MLFRTRRVAPWRSRVGILLALCAMLLVDVARAQVASPSTGQVAPAAQEAAAGPVRLTQPTRQQAGGDSSADERQGPRQVDAGASSTVPARPPYRPGEFEQFVQRLAGDMTPVQRFGSEFLHAVDAAADDAGVLAPSEYVLAAGDEIRLTLWGSVEADLRLVVDPSGRIAVPRIGSIQVAGLRQADLADALQRRIGQTFRNFQMSVALGQLRSIRILVTGFAVQPGSHVVSSLSSLSSALIKAGGPSAAGSFRRIDLIRRGRTVASLDLYRLLLNGDRGEDPTLLAGDIVHVSPVGSQVGVIGSVNRAGIFELARGETVQDALTMAGGFTAVADKSRVTLERLSDRLSSRITELALPQGGDTVLSSGDVIRALSAIATALPSERQAKRVKVEGEVNRPAEYILPAGSTVSDAIAAAGGLTDFANVYAAEFYRESVRVSQGESYRRALRDLETDFARSTSSQRTASQEDAAAASARVASTTRLLERLRALQPDGRIVLQSSPDARELPPIALEDGDRILVPSRPTTVGVFGSVFNGATYLYAPGRSLDDYLRLAGGPTKGADESSIFVVRANGTVLSRLQGRRGWLSSGDGIVAGAALPGDTIFVPEEMNKITFVQGAKDWTQILYQFGIGLAGIVSAVK